MRNSSAVTGAVLAAFIAGGAQAATYDAVLNSAQSTVNDESTATGMATLVVDEVAQTLDFMLSVTGIGISDLADLFVDGANSALGPVHIHDGVVGTTGPVAIPFPGGMDGVGGYSATADGFMISVVGVAYSDALAISGFGESFADFVAGLDANEYYINVHTDSFVGGEIRGQLAAVPLPAAGLLLIGALGVLGGMRRRSA